MTAKALIILALLLLVPLATADIDPVHERDTQAPVTYNEGWVSTSGVPSGSSGCSTTASSTCLRSVSTSGNYDYLGWDLPAGKRSYAFEFDWLAGSDGATSGFIVSFALDDGAPSVGTKGKTTGTNTNSVQFRFKEDGSDTHIVARTVKAGVISDFWSSTENDNPNDQQKWRVQVDMREGVASIYDLDTNTPVMEQAFTGFTSRDIHSVWAIARGYSSVDNNQKLTTTNGLPKVIDTDEVPPTVSDPVQLDDDVQPNDPVTIRVAVTDDWGLEDIVLRYTKEGAQQPDITMVRDTGNFYTGTIPGQSGGQRIVYWVEATDNSHLTTESSSWAYTVGVPEERTKEGDGTQFGTNSGGGSVQNAFDMTILLFAALIAVAGFVVSRMVQVQTGNTSLGSQIAAGGVLAALGYAFYAANIADVQTQIKNMPNIAWVVIVVGVVGLIAYQVIGPGKVKGKRRA